MTSGNEEPKLPNLPQIAVTAIDPGEMTGVVEMKGGMVWSNHTMTVDQMINECAKPDPACMVFRSDRVWIVEQFRLYPWKIGEMNFNTVIPARIIGALEAAAIRAKAKIVFQHASDAKNLVTDTMLKKYKVYDQLETRHERDAARHIIYYYLSKLNHN